MPTPALSHRTALALLLLAALALAGVVGAPRFSGATYVTSTTSTATVQAARDWTPPTVSMIAPAATVQGVVTVSASADDTRSGVKDVAIQYAAGTGWVTICTVTTAPYSCVWDTRSLADGGYSLRAVATDNDGYTATSSAVSTTVANKVLVVLATPGGVVRGTVGLTAALHGAGSTVYAVRIEYAPSGSTSWRAVCTRSSAPYTCDWDTTPIVDQDYDLRAVATSGGTTHVSAVVPDVLVDNAVPVVTLLDPGSPLRGTATFATNATDGQSGVARVTVQYAVTGSTTFQDLCATTSEPWSCAFDTTLLKDGSYSFRALATDAAGNMATSAVVANRSVDNTVSSVSLNDPGVFLNGTVTLAAAANSTAGVTSVRIQRVPSGGSAWTDICTDAAAPYSCAWNTAGVTDGSYDLRAVLLDGAGRTTVSTIVGGRRIDNNPVRGVDVQTVSGGAIAGRLDQGDRVTFRYSEQLDLGSIAAGWSGGPLTVSLRLRDGNLLGLGNKGDTLDVLLGGAPVNLGSVNLKEDYLKSGRTAVFAATLTASTLTVNGAPTTVLTVSVGGQSSGQAPRTVTLASTMVWTPSSAAADLGGRSASNVPVFETGTVDREF